MATVKQKYPSKSNPPTTAAEAAKSNNGRDAETQAGYDNAVQNRNARVNALKDPDYIKQVDDKDKSVVPVQLDIANAAEAANKFKDNVLNTYTNTAYYLRLTMIHPQLVSDWKVEQGVVIAETAATADMVIDECTIKSVCNWDSKSQNVTNTTGRMVIVEPLGVRFLDMLVRTANALRISNHTQASYYLEVTFKGTNETGENIFIPDTYFIWPIVFKKVTMNIDANGGKYDIEFVHQEVQAQELIVENLKDIINVSAATVGEYFTGLATALNQKEKNKVYASKLVPHEYVFQVDPEIAKYRFANFNPSNISTSKSQQSDGGKGKQVFREGSGILGLINVILAGTDEMQQLQRVERKGSAGGEKGLPSKITPDEAADPYQFFRVQTWTEAIEFDSYVKDYAKKITYKIIPWITPQIVTPADQDAQQGGDDNINKETVKKRFMKMKALNMLNKRYDYLYTGRNTEVMNFNIKLENSYFQPVPTNGTAFADTSQHGDKIKGNPNGEKARIDEARKEWKDNAKALKDTRDGFYLIEGNRQKRIAELETKQKNNPWMKEKQNAVTTLLGPIKKFGQNAPQQDPHQIRVQGLTYQDSTGVVDNTQVNAGWLLNRFLEDDTDQESTQGMESPFSNNRGSFGYIFNQLKASADLCKLDPIEIIGDPFWFGVPNSILLEKLAGNNQAKYSNSIFADYNKGGNYMYLAVQTPSQYNDDGLMTFDTNQMISGLYLVTNVEHHFKGNFTQKLTAVRDANIINSYLGIETQTASKKAADKVTEQKSVKKSRESYPTKTSSTVPNTKS